MFARVRRSGERYKFSFGFALFMQRKDENNPRGYTEKSIVILTNMPLNQYIQISSKETQKHNYKQKDQFLIFKFACEQISNWEKPQPNKLFNLQIFNNKIAVEILHYLKMQMIDSQMNFELQEVLVDLTLTNMIQFDDLRDIGQFQEANIVASLPQFKNQNQKPCYVSSFTKVMGTYCHKSIIYGYADSPYQCSEIILGMICLISHSGDFR